MSNRLLVLVAAVGLLGGLGWFLTRSGGPPAPAPDVDRGAQVERTEAPTEEVELADAEVPDEERSAAPVTGPVAPTATTITPASLEDHPWAGSFAGLTGRLVETDGSPIEGLVVELYEFDVETVFSPDHHPVREELCMGSATSDAEGRFTIGGARSSGVHGLAIDPGGGRYTIRGLDTSLEFGETKDVGDIVLQPGGVVVGTVIDEDGEPVEGARVRFAPVPEIVVQSGALDLRSDSLVAVDMNGEMMVVDGRAKYRMLVDRLPASTGTTDAEGKFRIEGVPLGRVTGGADAPGLLAGPIEGVEVTASGEVDVGEIELLLGRTITGKVVDAADRPVADAEVRVGALSPLIPVGLLQPGVRTGPDGTFELDGVPEEGQVIGAARKSESDEWVATKAVGGSESITLRLPTLAPLRVEVVDAEGSPISGAKISAIATQGPPEGGMSGMAMQGLMGTVIDNSPKPRRAEQSDSGIYVVEELPTGWYSIEAEAPGYGVARTVHKHVPGGAAARIECGPAWTLSLRFVDDATDEPVAQVHSRLMQSTGVQVLAGVSSWSDETGFATLGPLGEVAEKEEGFGAPFNGMLLASEHPSYARSFTSIKPSELDPSGTVEVRLKRPSSVAGRVTWDGRDPQKLYMISLERRNERTARNLQLPMMAVSGPDGSFRVGGVPPGEYRVELMERFLDRDPLSFITEPGGPTNVARDQIVTVSGEETELNFALLASGEAAPGWFEGRVRVEGQVPPRTVVKVGYDDQRIYPLDGNGNFRTDDLPANEGYSVRIVQEAEGDENGSGEERVFYNQYRRPSSGQGTRIDIDIFIREIVVNVVDSVTLEPVKSASVSVSGGSGNQNKQTSEEGLARFELPGGADSYEVNVNAMGYASEEVSAEPKNNGPMEVQVRLERSVPCAGTIVLPKSYDLDGDANVWLLIGEEGSEGWSGNWVNVDENLAFKAESIAAGNKIARLWTGGQMKSVPFEVPPGGSETLLIDFSEF